MYPSIGETPGYRKNNGADKQSGNSIGENAADDSDQRDKHRGRKPPR